MTFETSIQDQKRLVELFDDRPQATVGEENLPYTFKKLDATRYVLRVGNTSHVLSNITLSEDSLEFTLDGVWHRSTVKDEQMLLLDRLGFKVGAKSGEGVLKAPMPGKIVSIMVEEGAEVQAGDPVVILEAMKMENELKAPSTGRIKTIPVTAGQSVEKNEILLEIEAIG